MSLFAVILSSALLTAPAVEGPTVTWKAPSTFLAGAPYEVEIEVQAPEGGADVEGWIMTPAAFTLNGKPLAKRGKSGSVHLPAGFKLVGKLDLGAAIVVDKPFELGLAKGLSDTAPISVGLITAAPAGVDFMKLPAEELGQYKVKLSTNQGDIMLELWPDVAPNHVRNFLDLAYTQFYDGTTFHRVIENFMVQGGDPTGTGSGTGPRKLTLEVSEKPHLRGVLSMARTTAPDGASCQFFIVHGDSRHLDGQYTAFGQVLSGMDAVDKIATTKVAGQSRPVSTQSILSATVVRSVN